MDGLTSISPFAFAGSLLVHAAFGAAVVGFGTADHGSVAVPAPVELVAFEVFEPHVAPLEPDAVAEPEAPREAVRPSVARRSVTASAPVAPLPVPAAPASVEPCAVQESPVPGLPVEALTSVEDAAPTAVGSVAGAKSGVGPGAVLGGAMTEAVRGVTGGTGNADRSRAAGLADGLQWDCPFPREADDEGIDSAQVTLQLRISAAGSVQDAAVLRDPGFGFGAEARRCAMRRRWHSQLNREGQPVAGTAVVKVSFGR